MKKEKNNCLERIRKKYRRKKLDVLIVGAGALANFVAAGLRDLNLGKVTIVDKDEIEETNLNRQILYFDAVGKKKADVLLERLSQINPKNSYRKKISFIDEKSNTLFRWYSKPDIIIDCVDNFKTRSILNKFAVIYNIPLLSGGTSPFNGQMLMYIPGKTNCLDCEIEISKLAKKAEKARRGCTRVPEGSVVTTNQIIGGVMAAELKRVLEGEEPLHGIIKYMSRNPVRIGVQTKRIKTGCKCHTRKNGSFLKESADALTDSVMWVPNKIKTLFAKKVGI